MSNSFRYLQGRDRPVDSNVVCSSIGDMQDTEPDHRWGAVALSPLLTLPIICTFLTYPKIKMVACRR
jgi:hypothetical protein